MESALESLDGLQSLCSASPLACPDRIKRANTDLQCVSVPTKQRCSGGISSSDSYIGRVQASGEQHADGDGTPETAKKVNSCPKPEMKESTNDSDIKAALSAFEKQVRSRILSVEYEKQWTDDCNSFDYLKALRQAASLLPPVSPLSLPRKTSHSRLLVFDLDNTLVYCTPSVAGAQHVIQIPLPTGKSISAGIRIRPYAAECLRMANQYFEVAIFTASHSCYSSQVIDLLDPEHNWVQHRLFREHCLSIDNKLMVKDLRIIDNFALKDIAIVENSLLSFGLQLYNGVPISTWLGQSKDTELKTLMSYLRPLAECEDVRILNRQVFEGYYSCLSDEDAISSSDS